MHEARRPKYAFDKLGLAELCLKSVIEGFGDIKPKIHFLLDSCPPEWEEMIKKTLVDNFTGAKWDYEIEHINCNNQNTSYLIQLDRARYVDDLILFQEDDYVYLPNVGKKIESAMNELEFVSPYDHRELYDEKLDYHKGKWDIKLVADQHWRTIDFNTMTWGCHSGRLSDYWEELHLHGFWDMDTWKEMAKAGAKLWSPIPSLATHMHADFLASGINWYERFNDLEKQK